MKILKMDEQNVDKTVAEAFTALLAGKVLACPTDTVYGLLGDATNEKAVAKIFRIKGREQGKPLPIFVKTIAMAKKLAKVSPLQEKFLGKVWPGKVTVVLESRGKLPEETGTKESIGLRIPNHQLVQMILRKAKIPLTGTSANLSGEPPLYHSKEIFHQFQNRKYTPDILIDAGRLPFSQPSKVIDITGEKPKILRK